MKTITKADLDKALERSAWAGEWEAALKHATAGRDSAPDEGVPLWLQIEMAESREAVRRVTDSVRRHSPSVRRVPKEADRRTEEVALRYGLTLVTLCDLILGEDAEDRSDAALVRAVSKLVRAPSVNTQRNTAKLNDSGPAEEVARLRAALTRLRDCDWVISPQDRMDAVRDIARTALGTDV